MIPTPRTDEERKRLKRSKTCPSDPVSADFARQLERENAELLEALEAIARLYENPEPRTMNELSARVSDMRCIARAAITKAKSSQ